MNVNLTQETERTVERILDLIMNKKGEDIVVLDLRKVSSVSDFFILTTGSSGVHVRAIADEVKTILKKEDSLAPWHIEGYTAQKWILVDYVDIVVHIFDKETRSYYSLEKLWKDAGFRTIETNY